MIQSLRAEIDYRHEQVRRDVARVRPRPAARPEPQQSAQQDARPDAQPVAPSADRAAGGSADRAADGSQVSGPSHRRSGHSAGRPEPVRPAAPRVRPRSGSTAR